MPTPRPGLQCAQTAIQRQFSAFISGVTIQNGLSGGIGVEGGNLSLYNSIVTGNTGTGIGSNSGTVTIVNSTISGNSVGGSTPSVGGVTAQGYLTLYQTTVKNNSVTKGLAALLPMPDCTWKAAR
jgi:hypothetical protein